MSQQDFSRLWDNYETDKAAMQARNAAAKRLRAKGHRVTCSALRNQIRPYAGLGQPDGRSCTVYMLTDHSAPTPTEALNRWAGKRFFGS